MDALFRTNQPAEAEKVGLGLPAERIRSASDIYDALFRMYVGSHRMQDAENILKRKVSSPILRRIPTSSS